MNQTAVQWFFRWFNDNQEATIEEFKEAYEHALKLESSQTMLAWENGALPDLLKEFKNSREYINKMYNNETQK